MPRTRKPQPAPPPYARDSYTAEEREDALRNLDDEIVRTATKVGWRTSNRVATLRRMRDRIANAPTTELT